MNKLVVKKGLKKNKIFILSFNNNFNYSRLKYFKIRQILFLKKKNLLYNYFFNKNLFRLVDDENFLFLQQKPIVRFFKNYNIDTPFCFRKSLSLRKNNKNWPKLFMNILMSRGLKMKIHNFLLKIVNFFILDKIWREFNCININDLWKHFFLFFFKLNYLDKFLNLNFQTVEALLLKQELKNSKNGCFSFFERVNNYFTLISPKFMFYVYRVNKFFYKHSRGKKGKYLLVWKYIAPYKRTNLLMHWFLKQLKFINHNKLINKLVNLFKLLFLKDKDLLINRVKKVTSIHIYNFYKSTLFNTYKSIKT